MLFTDIPELQAVLDLPATTGESKKLLFFIEYATRIIEEVLDRPNMDYRQRTQYYNGTGTAKLLLRSRPAFTSPTPEAYVDDSGYWGQPSGAFVNTVNGSNTDQLTYGSDFVLKVDQDDGSSRSAILVKIPTSGATFGGSVWNKPTYRQPGYLSSFIGQALGNIKVVYYAGYTVDSLPAQVRLAANLICARLRLLFPLGMFLTSESYEDRSLGYTLPERHRLLELAWPLIFTLRSWKF